MDLTERCAIAQRIAEEAGELALGYFQRPDSLRIDRKGHQDFVSQADREVERLVRTRLAEAFPDDGIVGEEDAPVAGTSGFTWVIDPIDGTTNFINAIPAWTVVLAGVSGGKTQVGVIHDPCHEETFLAIRGEGATLNGERLVAPSGLTLKDGTTGIGFSNRVGTEGVMLLMQDILNKGGIFLRNASGALSIAYVAAGRLLGYVEEHMNAWDCLAAQLIVEEAGGGVEDQNADAMIKTGGRVVVGVPGVFEELVRLSDAAFGGSDR
ncbi:MAG: inositol monophosphatase family protein [Paracoccaceae bacterium]|nr:inositol monophosphatase family protein [Paracoccaceae bacterium]